MKKHNKHKTNSSSKKKNYYALHMLNESANKKIFSKMLY